MQILKISLNKKNNYVNNKLYNNNKTIYVNHKLYFYVKKYIYLYCIYQLEVFKTIISHFVIFFKSQNSNYVLFK